MASECEPAGPILDLDNALARLGGDRELFAELVGFLFEDVPKLCDELRAALAANDSAAVRMKAHALKGLVAGCGGVRATNAAQCLEDASHARDLTHAASLLQSLNTELELLMRALADYHYQG